MKTNLDNYIKQEAEISKIKHDMENVALTTTTLLQKHNYEKVQQHFSQMFDKLHNTNILHTDIKNVYINAIIQQKYSQCKSNNKNIDFICNSNGIFQKNEEIFNIDIFDICTIIGNLLNNAIEACETCEDKKAIKFKFVKEDDMIIIAVKNSFNYDVVYENGEIKSTKTSSVDEHGVGIKNVLKIIEKYGGAYVIEDKNKEFFFSIIIPT